MARLTLLIVILLAVILQVAALTNPRRYTILNRGLWAKTTPGETRREDYVTMAQEPKELDSTYLWELFPFPYDKALFRIKNVEKSYTAAAASDKMGSEIVAKQFGASNWRIEYRQEDNKCVIRLDGTNLVWTRKGTTILLEEYQNMFSQLWSFYPENTWYDGLFVQ
ncbi:hypothetical protein DFQ26_007557 [Actinomortierella ambigua]|nr:hypothetical protein DFQ26_007557 [Actinomortierella ambigua]